MISIQRQNLTQGGYWRLQGSLISGASDYTNHVVVLEETPAILK